ANEITEIKRVQARTRASEALGKIGDARAVEPLITAFPDQDSDVQLSILNSLAHIGDARAVPIFLAVLEERKYPAQIASHSQVSNARQLHNIGPLNISPPEFKESSFLERFNPELSRELEEYRLLEASQKQAKIKNNRPVMRLTAAKALGILKAVLAVQALISCLNDADRQLRKVAIVSLGQIGDVQAVHPLLTIDRGDDVEIDSMIIKALVYIGPSGTEALTVALDDENERVQSYAGRALGAIGGTQTVNLLITALEDRAGYVRLAGEAGRAIRLNRRVAAASALGEIRDGHALQPLIRALQDANLRLRTASASALGKLGDAAAVDYLIPCLQDPDPSLRWSSAEALGSLGDKRAIQPLLPLLRDANAGVKTSAVAALTKLGYDVLPLNWPSYAHALTGHNIIRVNNPNPFRVRAGIRHGSWGVDMLVPPGSIGECTAPDGTLEVYFQYATEPLSLYRGEQLALAGNGIEITIQKVYGGNYGVRKVE
ncbi:MAG: HEAT repeat domain-containing protein, partial [Anaerolineae bacterium]